MPVRSLHSSVLPWPTREQVDRAVREWAARLAEREPELVALGYFGSYALSLIHISEPTRPY